MRGFINITLDRTSNILPTTIISRIQDVKHVKLVHLVTGSVDAIAFVDAPDLNAFRDAIVAISRIKGVLSTVTNVAL